MDKELEQLNELKQRFGYMFAGPHIGLDIYRGWFHDFAQACEQIDALLVNDKIGFHFSQIKEKYGWSRYYFDTDRANLMRISTRDGDGIVESIFGLKDEHDIEKQIASILSDAEQKSMHKCINCSGPAEIRKVHAMLLCVCDAHAYEGRGEAVRHAIIRGEKHD